MAKIGYLGPKGSFTHIAMNAYIAEQSVAYEPLPYSNFFDLFEALQKKELSHIIIPIENSLGGEVYSTLDGLMTLAEPFSITAELLLEIEQSFMCAKGGALSTIKTIYTHPQSYNQCSAFIKEHYADADFVACASNADAAIQVASSKNPESAAIGHRQLCDLYDLDLLKQNISDTSDNMTRFVVLSDEKTKATGHDKSSFIFSTRKDKPGSLCDVLLELSKRSINMTRITSRPSKGLLGDYVFFIDCDGHMSELKDCFDTIKNQSAYFKFLGSYKRGE